MNNVPAKSLLVCDAEPVMEHRKLRGCRFDSCLRLYDAKVFMYVIL